MKNIIRVMFLLIISTNLISTGYTASNSHTKKLDLMDESQLISKTPKNIPYQNYVIQLRNQLDKPKVSLILNHSVKLSNCNLSTMLALNSTALVQYLESNSYSNCLQFLWNYDPSMSGLFTLPNMTAVLNEISTQVPKYDGTDDTNLLELLFFIRIAFYQNYYNPSDYDLSQVQPLVIAPITAFFNATHIYDITDVAGSILDMAVNTVEDAALDNQLFTPAYINTMVNLYSNLNQRLQYPNQQNALFDTEYAIWRSVGEIVTTVPDSLISILGKYSVLSQYYPNYNYILYNPMSILSNIVYLIPPSAPLAQAALENTYNTITPYTVPWTWAVNFLFNQNSCITLTTGGTLCIQNIKNTFKNDLFSQTFSYDNGQLNFNTALPQSVIDPLYYATKEVKAQFGRIIGNLTPVANDPNPTFNTYIFANANDYSNFLNFIFGADPITDGVYIESNGTYYTYLRTMTDSLYSLQEVLRNGYTRYLVGRFLVPGINPVDSVFANGRTVFYDEGTAEFFTGSSLTNDVQMRADITKQLQSDGSPLYNIGEILTANYWNDNTFHRYDAMLFHFLYTKHLDIFQNFNTLLAKGDGAGLDQLVLSLIFNSALNTEYQAYILSAIQNLNNLGTPTSVAPTVANLIYSTPLQIQNILINNQMLTQTTCSTLAHQTNHVFSCQGQITGASLTSQNLLAAWYILNQGMDAVQMSVLKNNSPTNLNWMSCRFGNIQFNTSAPSVNVPYTTYYCEGPLS